MNIILLKTLDLISTHIEQENKDELINLLNTEVPELRSYAFIKCLQMNKADFTEHFCDPNTFDPEDDFIIFESLLCDNMALMKFCISKGFDYTIHGLNPFDILVRHFNDHKYYTYRQDRGLTSDQAYQESKCVTRLKLLCENGYDIHMDHSRAFKRCTNCELLKYFIEMGTDVKLYSEEWVSNFLESYCEDKVQILKLMFDHGLSPTTNGGALIQWAFRVLKFDLIQLLDQYGVNFKEYEKEIIPNLGINAKSGSRVVRQNDMIKLEVLKIFWKHNCNLNLLNDVFIRIIIEHHYYQTLEWLFDNGIDIEKIYKEAPDNSDKINTFNVLVKNGISIDDAVRFI